MKRIVSRVPLPFHSVQTHVHHINNVSILNNNLFQQFTRRYSDNIDKKCLDNTLKLDFNSIPGVKSGGEKLIILYTCNVCETRSARKISKHSYQKGVVVVKCACCNNMHLICDHLGVFEDKGWTIDEFLSKHRSQASFEDSSYSGPSQNISSSKYITEENVYELTMQDIIGSSTSESSKIETALMGSSAAGCNQSISSLKDSSPLKSHSHSVDTTMSSKDDGPL